MKLFLPILFIITFKGAFAGINKIDTLIVTDSLIIINDSIKLYFPMNVETLEGIFGKTRLSKDKQGKAQNDIYFWDRIGVMVFCKKGSREVTSFDICLRKSMWSETRRTFKGTIILGNNILNKNMSHSNLEQLGFGGASLGVFDEYRTLELLKIRVVAEFKESSGNLIGFGIFGKH